MVTSATGDPGNRPPRILLVEDEQAISEPLVESLTREGFDANVASTVAAAEQSFDEREPDLVLLDVMLPDGDGRDLCRDIRRRSDVPIIMLTARGEEVDRVVGLELGADDYVVKPFSARELAARIRAILRRGRGGASREVVEIGPIRLDSASRTVTKDGKPWFCFGVMGGDMQAQGHVQVLVNMIDFGMNVQAAGDMARVMHTGSATPTGLPAEGSGEVNVETEVSDEAIAKLRAKGHNVTRTRRSGTYGGYQGILIDHDHGTLHGGTDPRKDGCAVGY